MNLTKEDIRDTINEVLNERARIDEQTHVRHHHFIDMQIEEYERKKRLREDVTKQVVGWGVVVALGAIGSAVYAIVTGVKTGAG